MNYSFSFFRFAFAAAWQRHEIWVNKTKRERENLHGNNHFIRQHVVFLFVSVFLVLSAFYQKQHPHPHPTPAPKTNPCKPIIYNLICQCRGFCGGFFSYLPLFWAHIFLVNTGGGAACFSSPEFSTTHCSELHQHAGRSILILLRSSMGGVAYATVFNISATWAATFRLREYKCMLDTSVCP